MNNEQLTEKEKKQIQKDVLEHWHNTREGKNEDEVSGFFVSIEMNWLMEYFEKLVSERVALAKQEVISDIRKDVINGVEYNKQNYNKDEVTKEQVFAYLRYWEDKIGGGKAE